MPGHGDKVRPQGLKVQGQGPRRLGGVHDQGHTPLPAQAGDFFHGQDIAEHVGHVGTHRDLRPQVQLLPKGGHHGLRPKQRGTGDEQLGVSGVEGPGDGVVLIAGQGHPGSGAHQGPNGQIQAVGGAGGEDHLFRGGDMKQGGGLLPAGEGNFGRLHGRTVSAPPGAGQLADGPGGGHGHLRRFLQGGGRAVQIDHSSTS